MHDLGILGFGVGGRHVSVVSDAVEASETGTTQATDWPMPTYRAKGGGHLTAVAQALLIWPSLESMRLALAEAVSWPEVPVWDLVYSHRSDTAAVVAHGTATVLWFPVASHVRLDSAPREQLAQDLWALLDKERNR